MIKNIFISQSFKYFLNFLNLLSSAVLMQYNSKENLEKMFCSRFDPLLHLCHHCYFGQKINVTEVIFYFGCSYCHFFTFYILIGTVIVYKGIEMLRHWKQRLEKRSGFFMIFFIFDNRIYWPTWT